VAAAAADGITHRDRRLGCRCVGSPSVCVSNSAPATNRCGLLTAGLGMIMIIRKLNDVDCAKSDDIFQMEAIHA